MSLQSYYINLDSAKARSQSLESNYQERVTSSWPLHRINATNTKDIEALGVSGDLTLTEKACFFSHVKALEESLSNNDHAFILEDDAHFGVYSNHAIEQATRSLEDQPWDILYADLGLTNPANMVEFFMLRKELFAQGNRAWKLLKLENIAFVGATAYIVNRNSKNKLHQFLKSQVLLNIPFDLVLRNLVWSKNISAFMIFPFATTLSALADSSQIQIQQTEVIELVWNAFRRLVWLEGDDLESPKNPNLQDLIKLVADSRSSAIGDLLTLALANKFGTK
jgi:GR25 family glycosyltransferase involved in LPS biosynthesis